MADRPRSFASSLVAYSALRLAAFAVPLGLLFLLTRNAILSTVLAAAIGLGLSVVLLNRRRSMLSAGLGERLARRPPSDEAVEDAAVGAGYEPNASAAARPKP